MSRWLLRVLGLSATSAVLLAAPVGLVFWRTFEHGFGPAWDAVTTPAAQHALIAHAADRGDRRAGEHGLRRRLRARDRPPALPRQGDRERARRPAARALAGRRRPRVPAALRPQRAGSAAGSTEHGIQVVFALPGMVLVTIFVSLPFVVREVVPVLREIGTEQEQAAATLGASPFQTFRRVTLPAIRWAVALRRRADDGARARRVRRGQRHLRPHRRQDRDDDAPRRGALPGVRLHRRLRCVGRARAARDRDARSR